MKNTARWGAVLLLLMTFWASAVFGQTKSTTVDNNLYLVWFPVGQLGEFSYSVRLRVLDDSSDAVRSRDAQPATVYFRDKTGQPLVLNLKMGSGDFSSNNAFLMTGSERSTKLSARSSSNHSKAWQSSERA